MPKTSRRLTVHPLTLREVEVVRVADLTPGMRRVTLSGEQLRAFTSSNGYPQPAFDSPGFDDDIDLLFCYPGEGEPVLPVQQEKGVSAPRSPRPLAREYTVRRWSPEAGELDIDFVKHGVGVGTTWARRAQPGDRIHFTGPSSSKAFPASADWLLVAGDDTTIPAVARLLDELPDDARAQVFIEVAEDAHRLELRKLPHVEVTWLARDGAEPGATTLLVDAVRETGWWAGSPFAWIAGERTAVRDLRRHLVEDRAMPKADIEFTGYWRRGEVVALESDEAVPDPEKSATPFEKLTELTELIAPTAIRTAVELGIPELISRGVTNVTDLAARADADERALGKLLRYLHALDVLIETAPGHYGLAPMGEVLTVEYMADYLHPAGAMGREMLGIHGLTQSIRTGQASYAAVTGQTFSEVRTEQGYEDRYLERLAELAPALAAPVATSGILNGVDHLVIHSDGAAAQAAEFVAAHPGLRITICALPAQADWLRRDLPATIPDEQQRTRVSVVEQSVFEPSPQADAVFVIRAFEALPDADVTHALRRAAQNLPQGGRVLLVEETFDLDDLDEHDGEADLLALTVHGSGVRTVTELDRVNVPGNKRKKSATMTMTPLRRRGAALAAAALSAALVLTGCGTNSGDDSGDAPSGSAEGYPITVDSDLGEITLNQKPEKIVVVGDARYVDVLAALDEAPAVFGSAEDEQTALKTYPWLEGRYGEYDAELFPAYEVDAEAIGVLQPDLIILQTFGSLDEGLHKQLSAIAPVYADDNPENWENAVTTMGALTGKSEQAEKVVSEMKAEFSAARERIAGLQGKTFFAGSMLDGVLHPLPEMGIFATELGLQPADNMPVIPDRGDPISAENRDQITADVAFVASFASGAQKDLEDDPRYADLPAVRNGTMVILEPLIGLDNMTAVAPTTVPWLLERILPVLEESELNAGQ